MRINLNRTIRPGAAKAAFSLVEVVVAAGIMAIIYASLFAGISSAFNLLETTRENLRATQIMVSRLEGLRLCAWGSAQLFNTNIVPSTFTDTFYPPGLNNTANDGTIYYGTMTITQNPALSPAASYATNMALVTVSVTWTNGDSTPTIHSRSMSTYVAKYGMQNYIYYH